MATKARTRSKLIPRAAYGRMISTAGSRVLVSVAWASRAGKRVRVCKRGEKEATRMYARLPCVALRCVTLCRVARRTAVALAHTREKSRARGVNISLYRPKTMGRWPRLPWTSIGSAVPIAGACRGWRTRAPVRRACRQRHACGFGSAAASSGAPRRSRIDDFSFFACNELTSKNEIGDIRDDRCRNKKFSR